MIVYRHCDPRFPFLWEGRAQGAGRWNAEGSSVPVQYFADTPDGAWAEFLRHEEITTEAELANVRRALWTIDIPDSIDLAKPSLPEAVVTGGLESYPACQVEAERLRSSGAIGLRVLSAALTSGAAHGWKVSDGLQPAPDRNGFVLALFGPQPELMGWLACREGRPSENLLPRVRPLR
ncbi:RES family NAD+ phosphorylase [Nevskia soli]|uniref:RES family NAD+ phosphorylase n=1 Tax=Nevskia soli TaxID=418856 RepID=UPI0015D78470|nr:RES family NAD+ phosphorylase [Nevskia soli]